MQPIEKSYSRGEKGLHGHSLQHDSDTGGRRYCPFSLFFQEEFFMPINFNQSSVWNLKPISIEEVRDEVNGLLINGEQIILAFKTIRDQLIFTNKRIISVDVQGLTGRRKSFGTMPYSKIQYFSVQTPGFAEIIPDAELMIVFSNGFEAKFEFKGAVNIGLIGRMLSEYVL